MDTANPIICEFRNVSFGQHLPGGRELQVVENINLPILRDHITAILGPSGCGKSTLVRILAGLTKPTSGEVFVHGEKLVDLNPAVSLVFQSFALYPWLTAAENITMGLNGRGRDAGQQRALVTRAIDRVGMEGFEEAYPRELSAGMKKRISFARALVAEPELLVMDEPFSGLDVLAADNLRTEVINLWQDSSIDPSSVLMVTNNINEAVYMATRIVVMGSHPGQIRTVLENPLPYPRESHDPLFIAMADRIHDILTMALIPDEPVASPSTVPVVAVVPRAPRFEAFPNVSPGEIAGLLERLEADGGSADMFDLSVAIGKEFGKLLAVVKAAELLDFVDTPKHMVALAPGGRQYLEATLNERKRILNQQLRKLHLFERVLLLLNTQEGKTVAEDLVLEELAVWLPSQRPTTMLRTIVRWGRYAELLGYNANERRIYLDVESTSGPASGSAT
ncbi:MAG: nitrate/sulfonate/bicarbonate ABC transporter ATP-binding protein [Verrucomicrobiota bacterium]